MFSGPNTAAHAAAMASLTARLDGRIAFGGDYNPEQWPEATWSEDVAAMREAGVNLVSLGIFSWAWLQPKEGLFEFDWLDRILDLLHAGGIAVDLANASATPPPWFSAAHPESLPVDVDGIRRSYGARQAFCPSSPAYRAAAAALTRAVADRYADHPAVAMWHVHNEYGCHNWNCYCEVSAAAFRTWLQRRYGDLSELNDAWGTAFWSQRYGDWAEVIPPRRPSYNTFANPTQQLDFARFSSDELLACYRAEAAILRERSTLPVTTNFMGFFKPLDYWAWAAETDLVSNDHYRIAALGPLGAAHDLAMSADLMRSLAGGAPWLLMEHSTSAVNWQPRNPAKPAGQLRRDSLTHLARGADGALFFQWKASRAGAEKFHSALLPHAGTDSARWREVVALGADVAALAPVAGSRLHAEVALVFDWNSWWGVELDSHPSVDVDQLGRVRRWHRALWDAGIACDFVHPEADLSRYRVVLAPSSYLISAAGAANVSAVAERGDLVVGYFSGIVDENDHIRLGGYPGAFADALGVRVEEFSPLLAGETVELSVEADWLPRTAGASVWTEDLPSVASDVQVLARYADGAFPGSVALTRRARGDGRAWYVGTEPDDLTLAAVLGRVCDEAGVRAAVPVGSRRPGADLVVRQAGDQRFVFAVNGSDEPVTVPESGRELLSDRPWRAGDSVAPGDVAVIRVGPEGAQRAGDPTP